MITRVNKRICEKCEEYIEGPSVCMLRCEELTNKECKEDCMDCKANREVPEGCPYLLEHVVS